MRRFEQMNVAEPQRGAETLWLPIESPEVQTALMLVAYRDELKKNEDESELEELIIDLVSAEHKKSS